MSRRFHPLAVRREASGNSVAVKRLENERSGFANPSSTACSAIVADDVCWGRGIK